MKHHSPSNATLTCYKTQDNCRDNTETTGQLCRDNTETTGQLYRDNTETTGQSCRDNTETTGQFCRDNTYTTGQFRSRLFTRLRVWEVITRKSGPGPWPSK